MIFLAINLINWKVHNRSLNPEAAMNMRSVGGMTA
jgi:hypothetical protein